MSEHTPGPRTIKRFDESQILVLGPDGGDGKRELVATFTGEHRLENAALDAAGPELLAACEEAVRLYMQYGLATTDPACGRWINQCRAAIAAVREEK